MTLLYIYAERERALQDFDVVDREGVYYDSGEVEKAGSRRCDRVGNVQRLMIKDILIQVATRKGDIFWSSCEQVVCNEVAWLQESPFESSGGG